MAVWLTRCDELWRAPSYQINYVQQSLNAFSRAGTLGCQREMLVSHKGFAKQNIQVLPERYFYWNDKQKFDSNYWLLIFPYVFDSQYGNMFFFFLPIACFMFVFSCLFCLFNSLTKMSHLPERKVFYLLLNFKQLLISWKKLNLNKTSVLLYLCDLFPKSIITLLHFHFIFLKNQIPRTFFFFFSIIPF